VGDEQAETYLRLLAEAETRRAARGSGPGIARSLEQIHWAGDVLVTAGLLTPEDVGRVAAELEAALLARPHQHRSRYAHRMSWVFAALTEPATPPEPGAGQQITPGGGWEIAPVGQRIGVAYDRAPSDLYLMTLVRSPAWVTITAVMRMHWPDDGSSADLEITGAGPQHLPYGQLWAADDHGTRYRVEMHGEGGTLTWQGALGLAGSLPPDARWLDLIADGARLARIDLGGLEDVRPAGAAERARPGADPAPPGERMLAAAAEHILASAWDSGGPRLPERLAETVTVLTGAGGLAADSPTPGHLAALCQRLDVPRHGITAPAAAQIPDRWAEVLPPPGPGHPAGHPGAEWFAPLGPAAVDADGTRFAFAGLTSAGGRTFLHVVAAGLPIWPVGCSWWVRDGAGRWHLATETGPHERSSGVTARTGMSAFRLRLTPPLHARPDALEVEVTGRRGSVRAVVPVGAAPDMPDT
jgi:hypothetical protein